MPSAKACFTTAGLLLSLAAPMMGCGGGLPPVLRPPVDGTISVLVDPNVTIGIARNDRGPEFKPLFYDALAKGLTEAGYRVVNEGSADLTLHLTLAKVGYAKYGTDSQVWAEGLDLDVSGGGSSLAREQRQTVNWSDREGASTAERLKLTARVLVNEMSRNPTVLKYLRSRPAAPAVVESPTPPANSSPAAAAASAPAPAAAPATGGYVQTPVPAPAATP